MVWFYCIGDYLLVLGFGFGGLILMFLIVLLIC